MTAVRTPNSSEPVMEAASRRTLVRPAPGLLGSHKDETLGSAAAACPDLPPSSISQIRTLQRQTPHLGGMTRKRHSRQSRLRQRRARSNSLSQSSPKGLSAESSDSTPSSSPGTLRTEG